MSSSSGKSACARSIRGPDTRRNQRRKGASPQVVSSCRASEAMDALCGGRRAQYTAEIFSRANRLWLPINRAEPRRCAPHNSQPLPLQHTAEPTLFFFLQLRYRAPSISLSKAAPLNRSAGEQDETSSYLSTPPSWLLPPSAVLVPKLQSPTAMAPE